MAGRRWLVAAVVVVIAFGAVATAYALLVPALENADEASHLRYARIIAGHLALPGGGVTEKQQPPLYYLMSAGILRLGGDLHAVRLLSVVLGMSTIALVIGAARALAPGRPGVAVGAGALTAAVPCVAEVSASMSNDVLAWAAGAALLWCMATLLREETPSHRLLLATGVAMGVGLLAKETDWPIVVVVAAVVILRSRGAALRAVVLAGGPAVALSGWWFARNLATFHRPTPQLAPLTASHPYLRGLSELGVFISGAVRSFFGPERFDGGPLPRSLSIQVLTAAAAVAVVLALAVAGWFGTRRWPAGDPAERRVIRAGSAVGAAVVVTWVANSVVLDLQPQARYLIVAAALPATALAWTATEVWHRLSVGRRLALGAPLLAAMAVLLTDSLRLAVVRMP